MPRGFRQRDPTTGQVLVDISTRLPRIMGRVQISPGVNGSVTVPRSGNNPVFYWFNASSAHPDFNGSPKFTRGSDTISWAFTAAIPGYSRGGTLVYGRY